MSVDLRITPHGMLKDEDEIFTLGNGEGLLLLIQQQQDDLPLIKQFFYDIFIDYIKQLATHTNFVDTNLSPLFESSRPDINTCEFLLISAPPFVGQEYFDSELLYRFFLEFEQVLQAKFNQFSGSFTEFIRSLSPSWKNVGKVSFHLAENKNDTTGILPFAFMASFIYNSENDKPKHLPLATAVKAYLNDKNALESVLAPIQEVSKKSPLINSLLVNGRIFQPIAWSSQEAYTFLQEIPIFEEENIVVRIANLWKNKPLQPKVSVQLDVAKNSKFNANALLDFSVNISLGEEKLTDEDIQELLKSGGGLVRIKGQWIEVEPEKISQLLGQWKVAEELASINGISLGEGLRLLAGINSDKSQNFSSITDEYSEFEASDNLKQIIKNLENPKSIELPKLPNNLDKILRPYQYEGVKYLWGSCSLGFGVCLADDMGLGKTLQLLTLISLWKKTGYLKRSPVLLVLPVTLLANWKNESAKFTPELKIITLHPSELSKKQLSQFSDEPAKFLKGYDLALVSYGMLSKYTQLQELEFSAVIADEAQAIKNPMAKQSRVLRKLKGGTRIALTGTPVENRLADLWSIFDFINPGLLGNLKNFLSFSKELGTNYTPLHKLTKPFILRRLKSDKSIIADLPDKVELKVYCNLSKKQALLYQSCVKELEKSLKNEEEGIKRKGIILSSLMRFKQICNHSAQFLGDEEFSDEFSGKFLQIKELVESIAARQEKLLIFTQFREMTTPLHDLLKSCFNHDGLILHGGTPAKERAKLVETFQNDENIPFFVLSLKAAGTGLNLTAANHVIHFDRWWNPAVENQASDRAYRIGQKRNVLIHKFICKGTLEEKIDELIESKQNLANDILSGGSEKLLTSMNNDELLKLVKLEIK